MHLFLIASQLCLNLFVQTHSLQIVSLYTTCNSDFYSQPNVRGLSIQFLFFAKMILKQPPLWQLVMSGLAFELVLHSHLHIASFSLSRNISLVWINVNSAFDKALAAALHCWQVLFYLQLGQGKENNFLPPPKRHLLSSILHHSSLKNQMFKENIRALENLANSLSNQWYDQKLKTCLF